MSWKCLICGKTFDELPTDAVLVAKSGRHIRGTKSRHHSRLYLCDNKKSVHDLIEVQEVVREAQLEEEIPELDEVGDANETYR